MVDGVAKPTDRVESLLLADLDIFVSDFEGCW
jgi:hypothetical protein